MGELEAPPLSGSMEHYRLQVKERAASLARRRHSLAGGAIVASVLVGAAVLTVVGIGTSPTGVHRSAALHRTASAPGPGLTGSTPTGPFGVKGSNRPGPAHTSSAAPQDDSAGAATDSRRVVDPPSGSTNRAVAGTDMTVVLPGPARGRWGGARVVTGKDSILSFVHQAVDPGGGVQITLKPLKEGVASLEVPCIGNPTGSWHGTVKVTGG